MGFLTSLISVLLLLLININSFASVLSINGKITDAKTQSPLVGATVSIPDLHVSVPSNKYGEYSFAGIPVKGRFLIEIRYIGYKTITQMVDLSNTAPINFEMEPSVIEVHEVVVTGTIAGSDNKTNSTSVTSINKADMLSRPSNNIIDAISSVPGVSQVTTGAAVSKPVIRGLSYNRVITLSDGVKQEGQQWGDEHGIEIDQYKADRVEVLRGAASLQYGSDAMGGVINILGPFSPAMGNINGEILTNYATNNGLSGTSAMLQGNTKGFVWRGRGTYKNAYGYNTPDGHIPNTGFKETDLSALVGLNKSWGYTHLDLSSFKTKLGLPDFERNADGQFADEDGNIFSSEQLKSRDLMLPFQDVRHYKAALNSQFFFNKSKLRTTFAYQNNQRRELEESFTEPSLFFDLKTYSYDAKYYFQEKNGWAPAIGVSGAFQKSVNKAEELLVPDYDNRDLGGFAYIKKTWDNSTVNAGLRFDSRHVSGIQMEEEGEAKFSDFSKTFSNFSGAIGFTHNITSNLNFKLNVGSAFRAPNIAELSSEGVHEGTRRYEIGNPNLKAEQSLNTDASLEFHTNKIDAHLNVFNNYIDNYIFAHQLNNETIEAQGKPYRVFRYVQDNANLYGFEAGLTLHPISLIHFENDFSLTRGRNLATDNWLPFIPAPLLKNQLRFEPEFKSSSLKNTWFSVGIDNYFEQNLFDRDFESSTKGYTLLNASIGSTLKINNQAIKFYITGNNLLDKAYINHLSRLKIEGILNQGRNIVFGLFVPLEFVK